MWIIIVFLAIISALLQFSAVPEISIYGGIFDLTLVILLIFLFYGAIRQASIFLLISSVILTILSEIPIIFLILPNFILMIIYSVLSSRRIISRPSTLFSLPLFFIAAIVGNLIKLLIMQRFGIQLIAPVISSGAYTAIIGGLLYFLFSRIYHFINPQVLNEKIKISRL